MLAVVVEEVKTAVLAALVVAAMVGQKILLALLELLILEAAVGEQVEQTPQQQQAETAAQAS